MAHNEQWKVTCKIVNKKFYCRIHSSKNVAKRDFGRLCFEVEKNGFGNVLLEHRPLSKNNENFLELQNFEIKK
jgi:hypothetical protein